MKNIRPSISTKNETRYDIETKNGNYYIIKIQNKLMSVFKMIQDNYSGEWIEGQISGWDISEEVKDMKFENLVRNRNVTYRQMESLYVSQQFFI